MQFFTTSQLATWTNGTASDDVVLCAVSTESRNIPENCLFLPLIGERFDAHDFIPQVIEAGAAAVLSARDLPNCPIPVVRVADTSQALLDFAAGYRAQFDCPVIAITGSVGKTTTKGMTAAVLSEQFHILKTAGNRNNTIGMPLTALQLDDTIEAAVFEMGMNHFGEITAMTAAAQPNIAVITTIGTSHIEFLGSREGICQAKMEILDGLAARRGVAVLNGDEPLLWAQREKLARMHLRCVWFGHQNPDCTVRATAIDCTATATTFTLCVDDIAQPITLPLAGIHNVTNALAAATCGWLLGMEADDIAHGLAGFAPEGSRQRMYDTGGFSIFEDCYNASPDSMQAALHVLQGMPAKARHAVLGDMLELGDYTAQGHSDIGRLAAQICDHLWLFGQSGAQAAAQAALESGMPTACIHRYPSDPNAPNTHATLAHDLRNTAQVGDALLFKGSHSMHMEQALALFLEEDV